MCERQGESIGQHIFFPFSSGKIEVAGGKFRACLLFLLAFFPTPVITKIPGNQSHARTGKTSVFLPSPPPFLASLAAPPQQQQSGSFRLTRYIFPSLCSPPVTAVSHRSRKEITISTVSRLLLLLLTRWEPILLRGGRGGGGGKAVEIRRGSEARPPPLSAAGGWSMAHMDFGRKRGKEEGGGNGRKAVSGEGRGRGFTKHCVYRNR